MMTPVLVCQAFQRGFIDAENGAFSVSACARRHVCEQVLKFARTSGWFVVHAFLDTEALGLAGQATIDGFTPGRIEPYFHQRGLSAFGAPQFNATLQSYVAQPIYLISFAGLGVIAATFLDGLEQSLRLHIVADAVADVPLNGVSEKDRLSAIETLASAYGGLAMSRDLLSSADQAPRELHLLGATSAATPWSGGGGAP